MIRPLARPLFRGSYTGKLLKQCWRSGANQNQLRSKELCGKMRHVRHGMISRSFRIDIDNVNSSIAESSPAAVRKAYSLCDH